MSAISRRCRCKEIAGKAALTGGPLTSAASVNAGGQAPGFSTQFCDVEVDPETGKVTILRFVAAQDVGKAIHPSYVEGQIQGGVVQGIGWALNEEYIYDQQGRLDNAGFLDYRCPVASDLPMIETIMVEVPNPTHPYGAKGVGEVNICPPMAAIANAIENAIGVRLTELPMSPPQRPRRGRRDKAEAGGRVGRQSVIASGAKQSRTAGDSVGSRLLRPVVPGRLRRAGGPAQRRESKEAGRWRPRMSCCRAASAGATPAARANSTSRRRRCATCIKELDRRYPGLGDHLVEETTVAIDGEIHDEPAYFQKLRDGCEIFFIPKLEGG